MRRTYGGSAINHGNQTSHFSSLQQLVHHSSQCKTPHLLSLLMLLLFLFSLLLGINHVSAFLTQIHRDTSRQYYVQLSSHLDRRSFVIGASLITAPSVIANAAIRDPKTGILLPSPGEIETSIPTEWEDDNPFSSTTSTSSFARLDSSSDSIFYSEPRFVEHVDDSAVESMTSYVTDRLLHSGDSVLDLCSSWTSHIRPSTLQLKRVAGLGMNAKELEANSALTEWTVLDLNADRNVKLPYEDRTFDVVMCQLSIDYLVHPLEVMQEAARVLKVRSSLIPL